MEEIFKDIPDYEGLYQASNLGGIKSCFRKVSHKYSGYITCLERILKTNIDVNGYRIVKLYNNNKKKTFKVSLLVWDTFGDKPRNGRKIQVDHINNIKTDDRFKNLQLLTGRENTSKGYIQKGKKTSKYTGVSWDTWHKKWRTTIQINGNNKHLGYFNTEIEAYKAYQKAKLEIIK